jgi:hypothetical protein
MHEFSDGLIIINYLKKEHKEEDSKMKASNLQIESSGF